MAPSLHSRTQKIHKSIIDSYRQLDMQQKKNTDMYECEYIFK